MWISSQFSGTPPLFCVEQILNWHFLNVMLMQKFELHAAEVDLLVPPKHNELSIDFEWLCHKGHLATGCGFDTDKCPCCMYHFLADKKGGVVLMHGAEQRANKHYFAFCIPFWTFLLLRSVKLHSVWKSFYLDTREAEFVPDLGTLIFWNAQSRQKKTRRWVTTHVKTSQQLSEQWFCPADWKS